MPGKYDVCADEWMSLVGKVEFDSGMSITAVGHHYSVNRSLICYVTNGEDIALAPLLQMDTIMV
jgi:hypothetical protein